MDSQSYEFLAYLKSKGGAVAVGQGNSATVAQQLGMPREELADVAHRLELDGLVKLERTTAESFFVELTQRGESSLEHTRSVRTTSRSNDKGRRRSLLVLVLVSLISLLIGIAIGYVLANYKP